MNETVVVDVILTIGEFSKMTYLSVKALRHYHDVGLLTPVDIDAATGYRHYASIRWAPRRRFVASVISTCRSTMCAACSRRRISVCATA